MASKLKDKAPLLISRAIQIKMAKNIIGSIGVTDGIFRWQKKKGEIIILSMIRKNGRRAFISKEAFWHNYNIPRLE